MIVFACNFSHNGNVAVFYKNQLVEVIDEAIISQRKNSWGCWLALSLAKLRYGSPNVICIGTIGESGFDQNFFRDVGAIQAQLSSFIDSNTEICNFSMFHHLAHFLSCHYRFGKNPGIYDVVDNGGNRIEFSIWDNIEHPGMLTDTHTKYKIDEKNSISLLRKEYIAEHITYTGHHFKKILESSKYINNFLSTDYLFADNNTEVKILHNGGICSLWSGFESLFQYDSAGKLMATAAYAEKKEIHNWYNSNWELNSDYFCVAKPTTFSSLQGLSYRRLSNSFINDFDVLKEYMYTVQYYTNKYYEEFFKDTNYLSGGLGYNCVANGNHYTDIEFDPYAGDIGVGIGIGCIYYHSTGLYNNLEPYSLGKYPCYYDVPDVFEDEADLDEIVSMLTNNQLLAFFGGPYFELGPRALGRRSFIMQPTIESNKDLLNKVKSREWFRPVACCVLESEVKDWFHVKKNNMDQMNIAVKIKEDKKSLVPAIVHKDDTCRIQTVNDSDDFYLYNVLKKYYQKTGIPILCNTSFNIMGRPICYNINNALEILNTVDSLYAIVDTQNKKIKINENYNPK